MFSDDGLDIFVLGGLRQLVQRALKFAVVAELTDAHA